jgi:hypothetical protein
LDRLGHNLQAPGAAQERDAARDEKERQSVGGVGGADADDRYGHTSQRRAGEPSHVAGDRPHRDCGGDVLAWNQLVSEQRAGRAVRGRDDAAQHTEHHHHDDGQEVEGGECRGGEGDRGERDLAHRRYQSTWVSVGYGTAEDAEQEPWRRLGGQRQAGHRDRTGELQHQQVLGDHLHPGACIAEDIDCGPQQHAAMAQAAPRALCRGLAAGGGGRNGTGASATDAHGHAEITRCSSGTGTKTAERSPLGELVGVTYFNTAVLASIPGKGPGSYPRVAGARGGGGLGRVGSDRSTD